VPERARPSLISRWFWLSRLFRDARMSFARRGQDHKRRIPARVTAWRPTMRDRDTIARLPLVLYAIGSPAVAVRPPFRVIRSWPTRYPRRLLFAAPLSHPSSSSSSSVMATVNVSATTPHTGFGDVDAVLGERALGPRRPRRRTRHALRPTATLAITSPVSVTRSSPNEGWQLQLHPPMHGHTVLIPWRSRWRRAGSAHGAGMLIPPCLFGRRVWRQCHPWLAQSPIRHLEQSPCIQTHEMADEPHHLATRAASDSSPP
jgi:hypothetical protein